MVHRITFDDDGNALSSSEEAIVSSEESEEEQPVEEEEGEESSDDVVEEASSNKKNPQPLKEDDSSDSDDAPEEVAVSSRKAQTIQLYEKQKQAALTTKRRKRKQRNVVEEEELDESTLALLSSNPNALSANPTADDTTVESKHIDLVHTAIQPTEKVEKKVNGFKLVALPKDPYAGVGKPINTSILDFQRNHFYGKGSRRVDSASFLSQKRVKIGRKNGSVSIMSSAYSSDGEIDDAFPNENDFNTNMLQVYGEPIVSIIRNRELLSEDDITVIERFYNTTSDISEESADIPVFVISRIVSCVREKDDLFQMTIEFASTVLDMLQKKPDMINNVLSRLLQQSLSLKQQELMVNICAEAVLIYPEEGRIEFFLSISNNIITLVNSRSAIEEESAVFISVEFIRIILQHQPKPSLDMRYAIDYFLLTLLSCGFVDGVFQKRTTNRTRVLTMLNAVDLPLLCLLDYNYDLEYLESFPSECESSLHCLSLYWPTSLGMLAYIVFSQHYPYFNFPQVFSPQRLYTACSDVVISLMLSDNLTTKQSALSLFSSLLNAIPLHSLHFPICKYSFTVLSNCGLITSFSILTLLHYSTHVLLSNKREDEACLLLTSKSMLASYLSRFVAILDEDTEFPFLIALLRFYLDEHQELVDDHTDGLSAVPKEEDILAAFGHQEPVVHRGEAIKEVDSTTKFDNSLMKLNYNEKTAMQLTSTLNSMNGKQESYELMRYSSYLDFVCFFLLKKVEGLAEELSDTTIRYLKIACRLLMSVLYTLPERISFLQLETVVEILKVFCAIGDKYYEPVMEYVQKHKAFLLHALQRVATNLRENNQLVMMWYAETNYGETEEQQRAISLVSSFYQQLSLMSYAYEFSVAIWGVCQKQCKRTFTSRSCR